MYRCTPGFLLAFCTCICSGAFIVLALPTVCRANPGVMVEPQSGPRKAVDPVVERVRSAILREVSDSRYDLRIYNLHEYVLLQGEVDSHGTRERIVAVARGASAKAVRDEMRIRPAPADDQIAASVRSALAAEYPGLAARVTVDVRDGVAYLSGDVSNHREVDELLATTLMIQGVKDVRSDITLQGRPYAHRHLRMRRGPH
jgi:osmotically-inducible protein OsmY